MHICDKYLYLANIIYIWKYGKKGKSVHYVLSEMLTKKSYDSFKYHLSFYNELTIKFMFKKNKYLKRNDCLY